MEKPNFHHDNRPATESFDGAICMCNKCQNRRDAAVVLAARSCGSAAAPGMPAVNVPVLVTVREDDGEYSMVAHRVHKDIFQSFVYYSPHHGEEYPLDNVVSWRPLS